MYLATDGEVVIVPRKKNKNVVVISEAAYNELQDKHDPRCFSDHLYWQTQDRKNLKYRPGYPRRIDDGDRLVYDIDEMKNIVILSCKDHYDDK